VADGRDEPVDVFRRHGGRVLEDCTLERESQDRGVDPFAAIALLGDAAAFEKALASGKTSSVGRPTWGARRTLTRTRNPFVHSGSTAGRNVRRHHEARAGPCFRASDTVSPTFGLRARRYERLLRAARTLGTRCVDSVKPPRFDLSFTPSR